MHGFKVGTKVGAYYDPADEKEGPARWHLSRINQRQFIDGEWMYKVHALCMKGSTWTVSSSEIRACPTFVGRWFMKEFFAGEIGGESLGLFKGEVTHRSSKKGKYHVKYDDGEVEEMEEIKLYELLPDLLPSKDTPPTSAGASTEHITCLVCGGVLAVRHARQEHRRRHRNRAGASVAWRSCLSTMSFLQKLGSRCSQPDSKAQTTGSKAQTTVYELDRMELELGNGIAKCGAAWWDPSAEVAFVGLSCSTCKQHGTRAHGQDIDNSSMGCVGVMVVGSSARSRLDADDEKKTHRKQPTNGFVAIPREGLVWLSINRAKLEPAVAAAVDVHAFRTTIKRRHKRVAEKYTASANSKAKRSKAESASEVAQLCRRAIEMVELTPHPLSKPDDGIGTDEDGDEIDREEYHNEEGTNDGFLFCEPSSSLCTQFDGVIGSACPPSPTPSNADDGEDGGSCEDGIKANFAACIHQAWDNSIGSGSSGSGSHQSSSGGSGGSSSSSASSSGSQQSSSSDIAGSQQDDEGEQEWTESQSTLQLDTPQLEQKEKQTHRKHRSSKKKSSSKVHHTKGHKHKHKHKKKRKRGKERKRKSARDGPKIACRVCTLENEADAIECEACSAPLPVLEVQSSSESPLPKMEPMHQEAVAPVPQSAPGQQQQVATPALQAPPVVEQQQQQQQQQRRSPFTQDDDEHGGMGGLDENAGIFLVEPEPDTDAGSESDPDE
jgi:hypothetical protein